jgi:hypothetical protein
MDDITARRAERGHGVPVRSKSSRARWAPAWAAATILIIGAATGIIATHSRNPVHPAGPGGVTAPGTTATHSPTARPSPSSHSGTPTAAPPAGAGPVCQPSQLKIAVISFAGWANIVGEYVGFTNEGTATCHLTGWPTLVAANTSGQRTTAQHVLGSQDGPYITKAPLVTLKPRAVAEFAVFATDYNGSGESTCPSPYHEFTITPPGSTQGTTISAWLPYSDKYAPSCAGLNVSPVVPPSDAPRTQ